MTLHVNEVAIQLKVGDDCETPARPDDGPGHARCAVDKAEIVADCVRLVLDELRARQER